MGGSVMREIKFRGKRIDNGEWVYGGSIIKFFNKGTTEYYMPAINMKCICEHDEADNIISFENCIFYKVIPETIGQYTGLKDKNGKEIYEGDIIQLINEDLEEIKVICEFGTAKRQIFDNLVEITGFYFKRLDDDRKTFPIINNYLGKHDLELFEVIGNIHDNPELLEVV
jgi:uncharacterized phage protein (TIGR01671 family)